MSKFGTASFLAHFWSQFLTDFDVTALKLKLMTSIRVWSGYAYMIPIRGLKMVNNGFRKEQW